MSQPSRATAAGRAYLDLRAKARGEHRPTQELLQLYVLEGFLARTAKSRHAGNLVLKGGVLLAAFDTRRPTRDVDFQATSTANDSETILKIAKEIAEVAIDDGIGFDSAAATAKEIREEEEYAGIRVSMTATLASARLPFHVDVNVGDPIWPAPEQVSLPRLLGGELVLQGYPLPMVFAEKLVTALSRGTANTRWRDYADVYLLSRSSTLDGDESVEAADRVAHYRQVQLDALSSALEGYGTIAQSRWATWRRRQLLEDRLPENFQDVLDDVIRFGDPILLGDARGSRWDPGAASWAS